MNYDGPIWIDPRFYQQRYLPAAWTSRTITTDNTQPVAPVSDERIRKIVREEIADLVKPDVPDAPPEDWS